MIKNLLKYLLAGFFSVATYWLAAQQKQLDIPVFSATTLPTASAPLLQKQFSNYKLLSLPTKEMVSYLKNGRFSNSLKLNISESLGFEMVLEPVNLVSPDYKLQIQTPEGVKMVASNPDFLYKGKVTGKNGGEVRLAIKNDFFYGYITDNEKQYFIEPLKESGDIVSRNEFLFYNSTDVIDFEFKCGSNELLQQTRQNELNNSEFLQGGNAIVCKKYKFFNIADYSIYQHYGESVQAVENFLLANMNNVQGFYTGFNFNPTDSTDIGSDFMEFEVLGSNISTCASCDVVDSSGWGPYIGLQLRNGLLKNMGYNPPYLNFTPCFWTMRQIFADNPVLGLAWGGINLLKHNSDNAAYLRLVNAHETGHQLGCLHDEDRKPGLLGFVMQSSANLSATRFSRLSDFGGVNYSSNLTIRQSILSPRLNISDCEKGCDIVEGLKIDTYYKYDSVKISWKGSGVFRFNYKPKEISIYDSSANLLTTANSVTLKKLNACANYDFKIEKQCNATGFGPASSLGFNTTGIKLKDVKPIFFRGELYDLECKVFENYDQLYNQIITIDYVVVNHKWDQQNQTILFPNLFADGARHRIDITNENNTKFCSTPIYFNAPYYRTGSEKILETNFDDCKLPLEWKDTVIQVASNPILRSRIFIGKQTPPDNRFLNGTLDSSCMLTFYNRPATFELWNGKLFYESPAVDLSNFKNVKLSFDYQFAINKVTPNDAGGFSVEFFNGSQWKEVFKYQNNKFLKPGVRYINPWDSLPSRVFLDVNSYVSKNFKLRFIADDGSFLDNNGNTLAYSILFSLDNILLDGYEIRNNLPSEFIFFPNPAIEEIFLRTSNSQGSVSFYYKILDISGRIVQSGPLQNNRVRFNNISKGLYFIQLFNNNQVISIKKIIKQ